MLQPLECIGYIPAWNSLIWMSGGRYCSKALFSHVSAWPFKNRALERQVQKDKTLNIV